MKIVVLGAGALGSIIGGHLAQAGEEVTVIARGQRAAYVQQQGITLTGLAEFTVPVSVTTRPHEVRQADVLVLTVKTYDTETALASVSHLQVDSVFSIQNGVLKDEQLAQTFGWEKTLGAAVVLSGEVTPAGPVRFTLNEYFAVGELPAGTSGRVQALVSALQRAGIRAEASPHIRSVEWSKYAFFMSWMAPALLTRLETYKFLSHPDTAVLVAQLLRETGLLAARLGIALEDPGRFPSRPYAMLPCPKRWPSSAAAGRPWAPRHRPIRSRPCRIWNAAGAWNLKKPWAMQCTKARNSVSPCRRSPHATGSLLRSTSHYREPGGTVCAMPYG
jgi:2-dehydropantoate 2-reductase